MIELLFVWTVIAQSGDRFETHYSKDWRLLTETTSCEKTAQALGYKPTEYRCVKK